MTWIIHVRFTFIIFPTGFLASCCLCATASRPLILLLGLFQLSVRNVLCRSSMPSWNQWAEQHISSAQLHLCLIFEISHDYSEHALEKGINSNKRKQKKKVVCVTVLSLCATRMFDLQIKSSQMPHCHDVLGVSSMRLSCLWKTIEEKTGGRRSSRRQRDYVFKFRVAEVYVGAKTWLVFFCLRCNSVDMQHFLVIGVKSFHIRSLQLF